MYDADPLKLAGNAEFRQDFPLLSKILVTVACAFLSSSSVEGMFSMTGMFLGKRPTINHSTTTATFAVKMNELGKRDSMPSRFFDRTSVQRAPVSKVCVFFFVCFFYKFL